MAGMKSRGSWYVRQHGVTVGGKSEWARAKLETREQSTAGVRVRLRRGALPGCVALLMLPPCAGFFDEARVVRCQT